MQENQPTAGGAGPEEGTERSRRTAAEIVADLERERDAEILKLRTKYDMKIARARKNATPIGERRRAALVLLDRLRDAFRTAHGDILLDEAVVDAQISAIFVNAMESNPKIAPEALEAALRVLDGKSDDDGAGGSGDGETPPAGQASNSDAAPTGGDASADASTSSSGATGSGQPDAGPADGEGAAPGLTLVAETPGAGAAEPGTPAAAPVAGETAADLAAAPAANDAGAADLKAALGF